METIWSKALDVLEERGWCQGSFENRQGGVCIEGALNLAMGARKANGAREDGVHSYLLEDALLVFGELRNAVAGRKLDDEDHAISHVAWNDDPNRTYLDVKTLLVGLHEREIKNMDIGEEKKEVEFMPLEAPAEIPIPVEAPPAEAPVEAPVEEPVPA